MFNTKSNFRGLGFTILELLIVIAMIGIMVVLVFGAISDSETRAEDDEMVAGLHEISSALNSFYLSNKQYPLDLEELVQEGYLSGIPSVLQEGGYRYAPLRLRDGQVGRCDAYHLAVRLQEQREDMGDNFNSSTVTGLDSCEIGGISGFQGGGDEPVFDIVRPREVMHRDL